MDHAGAVDHVQIAFLSAETKQQAHAGRGCGTSAEANNSRALQGFALNLQCVEHTGGSDYGSTVLVVMEDRDAALFDQCFFDFKALRGFDVFQVDATKGVGNAHDCIDKGLGTLSIDFDIDRVDAGKTFEQQRFAFHDGLAGQGA
ncbi:hypothetical protein D9M69_475190 [compost metagenome]